MSCQTSQDPHMRISAHGSRSQDTLRKKPSATSRTAYDFQYSMVHALTTAFQDGKRQNKGSKASKATKKQKEKNAP